MSHIYTILHQKFFSTADALKCVKVMGPEPDNQILLITKPMLPNGLSAMEPAVAATQMGAELGRLFGFEAEDIVISVQVLHYRVIVHRRSDIPQCNKLNPLWWHSSLLASKALARFSKTKSPATVRFNKLNSPSNCKDMYT